MDLTSPLASLLLFFVAAGLSGVLGGVKSVIGYYRCHNADHTPNGRAAEVKAIVERSLALWEKPGFFESISFGRFLLDGTAILAAMRYLTYLSDSRPMTLGLISILLCYTISHWMFPLLAHAFSPSLGKWALRLYKLYSFFFHGQIGGAALPGP